jgi:L-threonylcarbamoyladenylate synthase
VKPSEKKRAQILEPTPENITLSARILKQGGLVAIPTETVYGLAGNAFDPGSLSKIFLTKERPTFDPLIVHIAPDQATLAGLMREQLIHPHDLSDMAVKRIDLLIRTFWPGPLTLVLPKSDLVPDLATSGMETVAIRAPKHPVARALIQELGLGVCAPSANRFGRISPTSASDVLEELGDRIDIILDGGPCEIGLESTILRITEDGEPILLRPGYVTREAIESLLGTKVLDLREAKEGEAQIAPGRLASHYAPSKPFIILPNPIAQIMAPPILPRGKDIPAPTKIGLLTFSGKPSLAAETLSEIFELPVVAESLSESGDLEEAARSLFRKLRALDASDADYLVAEPIPAAAIETSGIAFAIADRLSRAAGPRG